VWYEAVSGDDKKFANRYRLLTDSKYRKVVTNRFREAYLKQGLINEQTIINYGLAAGHIHSGNEPHIREYFLKKRWKLFTPEQIKERVKQLSTKGWEDDLVTMTAKLILKK
jgi:superfamily II RNA helicase